MHTKLPECFVIMPIADLEGYKSGHFRRVYEQILQPACEKAGFAAIRADQVGETNLIQLDVLQRLLDSPMVLCDLSARNPNVLFELGIGMRQAFDKPVALVREEGTPPIFDIAPLRYTEYRSELLYEDVLTDQKNISNTIKATWEACQKNQGINSIVRLLSLTQPASLVDIQEAEKDPILQMVRAEINSLRSEFRSAFNELDRTATFSSRSSAEQAKIPFPSRENDVNIDADIAYIVAHGLEQYLTDVHDIEPDVIERHWGTARDFIDFMLDIASKTNLDTKSKLILFSITKSTLLQTKYKNFKNLRNIKDGDAEEK